MNNVNEDLEIYPNPASDYININTEKIKSINIYDLQGKLMKSIDCKDDITNVNISDFAKGVYFIETFDNKYNKNKTKLVVD